MEKGFEERIQAKLGRWDCSCWASEWGQVENDVEILKVIAGETVGRWIGVGLQCRTRGL